MTTETPKDQGSPDNTRKRPPAGERRKQILETLAQMLENPGAERITTAALAAQLEVSEAALYRHFASKAKMFEALLDFIESSIFGVINQITERESDSTVHAPRIVLFLLQFAEKNPGMTRVMVGDALVFEHERLQQRVNLLFDKLDASLRQALRNHPQLAHSNTPTVDTQARSSILLSFVLGRMHRFVRSGFQKSPTENIDACLQLLNR